MEDEPVTIVDRNVLKVLSADTRMDIIKELSQGNRTPSDLSKRLKKSDATIVEHLEVLCKAGLVKKISQPGKKWIFYTLTERGEGIIASKSRKLVIILGTSILSGVAGLGTFGAYLFNQGAYYGAKTLSQTREVMPAVGKTAPVAAISQTPWFLYLSIALIAVSLVGLTIYMNLKSRTKVMYNV